MNKTREQVNRDQNQAARLSIERSHRPSVLLVLSSIFLAFVNLTASVLLGLKDAKNMGELIGYASSAVMIPLIVVCLSRLWKSLRNVRASYRIFAIASLIILFANVTSLQKIANRQMALEGLNDQMIANIESKKESILNQSQPAPSIDDDFATITDSINDVHSVVEDDEKKILEVLQAFGQETYVISKELQTVLDKVYSIENPKSKSDILSQKGIVQKYVDSSKKMSVYFRRSNARLRTLLLEKKVSQQQIEGFMSAYDKQYSSKAPIVGKLYSTHVEYGNVLLEYLDFLNDSWGKWSDSKEQGITFNDAGLSETYNDIVERMELLKTGINALELRMHE
ncbi:MAG: hypothetical protein ACYSUY_14020 [Planctomycetota bacterium]|jgi:hypothetical protein